MTPGIFVHFPTRNTISLRVEVSQDKPTVYAWFLFQQIVNKRLAHARSNGVSILIDEIEIEEDMFGTEVNASISYRILQDLGPWVFNAGLFQPFLLTWAPWEDSYKQQTGPRGVANIAALPHQQDRLVNLENSELPVIADREAPRNNYLLPPPGTMCNAPPEHPQFSWLHWNAGFELRQSGGGDEPMIPMGPRVLEDGVLDMHELNTAWRNTGRTEMSALLPHRGGHATYITFRGEAIRAHWTIPLPKIAISGVSAQLLEDKIFETKWLGTFYCIEIYAAKWELTYVLTDLPGEPFQAKNPNEPTKPVIAGMF